MSDDFEIGRLNLLLEFFSDCAEANDLGKLVEVAGGRVRWLLEFQRFTLALTGPADCEYWTLTRDGERLERVASDALPAAHLSMIGTVLSRGAPCMHEPPISGLCHPLDAQGRHIGAICFSDDRTAYGDRDTRLIHHLAQFLAATIARLQQAATIQQQAAELASALRAKDEFLAILGHELRNPLAPIVAAVDILTRRAGGMPPREVLIIKRQAVHVVRLVDDLLDVSRLTSGKLELALAAVEIEAVVARAIEMAAPLIEQRQHRLEVDVPLTGLLVNGDENRLAQVFANLLTNAARYTEPGGRVQIVGRRSDHEIVIDVVDNGTGISPELAPSLFEMFVQGLRSTGRGQGGLGLGLAIVKSLTELHGGSVSVVSEGPNRGSTFTVRLPSLAQGTAPVAVVPPPRGPTARRRRVLIVDDNEDAAAAMASLLEAAGHDVFVFLDGIGTLAQIEHIRPEVALLDIGLPDMDGYELAREIRSRLGHATPYLIALTGYGQPEDHQRSRAAGFNVHRVKPIDAAELLQAVDAAPIAA
jgi:signal transduction histidine kinase